MRRPRKVRSLPQRIVLGAVAGFGATLALHQLMTVTSKAMPEAKPPMKQDPGEFMAAKVHVPESLKPYAVKSLQLGYGVTSGALYGALRNRITSPLLEGALLGIGVWAVGYLGWLPAAGLMPPIHEHTPKQIAVPILNHIVYGVVAAEAFDNLLRV